MKFTHNEILEHLSKTPLDELMQTAYNVCEQQFGNIIKIRGIIEFSNYCCCNCSYCGLRLDNTELTRYRLSNAQIFESAKKIHDHGISTVVLQSGEDSFYSDEDICNLVIKLKQKFLDLVITLSIGERSLSAYQKFKAAGADRYLLKHEAANEQLYAKHHDQPHSKTRRQHLFWIKDAGLETGTGFIVGLPHQTDLELAEDILFVQEFQPEMIGLGPFLSHHQTPLRNYKSGSIEKVLRCLALVRLCVPHGNIPATTALASLDHEFGLINGIKAGANVVMCGFTPESERANYKIYDNKDPITLEKTLKIAESLNKKLDLL